MKFEISKNKRNGIIATLIIHGLLLLLFIILGLTVPYPPPLEEGILISFGNTEVGAGEEQPESTENIPIETEIEQEQSEEPVAEEVPIEEEVVEQDIEEAPAIQPKKEVVKKKEEVIKKEKPVEKVEEPVKEKKPEVDQSLLFNKDKVNQSKSEGKDDKEGDKGSLDGELSKDGMVGLGNEGIGYDLTGRSMILKPNITDKSQATGKVVVRIKVDQYGKVVYAKYQLKGSTTNDPYLVRISEEAAQKAKFNSDQYAQEEQFGSITFTFKVK